MSRLLEELRHLLNEGDDVNTLEGCSEGRLVRALTMLNHDDEDIVRQRACRELGKIVSRMPKEKIDNFVRRQLWRLNPESGDHPFGVPELLGEIGNRAPEQIASSVPVMMNYLDDEKLRPGLLQAAGRIGEKIPEALSAHVDKISACLQDQNAVISGNAALALCRIGGNASRTALKAAGNDTREVLIFCEEEFRKVKLAELAGQGCTRGGGLCFISNREQV